MKWSKMCIQAHVFPPPSPPPPPIQFLLNMPATHIPPRTPSLPPLSHCTCFLLLAIHMQAYTLSPQRLCPLASTPRTSAACVLLASAPRMQVLAFFLSTPPFSLPPPPPPPRWKTRLTSWIFSSASAFFCSSSACRALASLSSSRSRLISCSCSSRSFVRSSFIFSSSFTLENTCMCQ